MENYSKLINGYQYLFGILTKVDVALERNGGGESPNRHSNHDALTTRQHETARFHLENTSIYIYFFPNVIQEHDMENSDQLIPGP